ncbi:MAG: serine hydroxymethyltransferase [Thermodesulfovibrionia bacterium]|nr:serine hydroxymethyltransferase [Thermodesulfovibrionia bacterium]
MPLNLSELEKADSEIYDAIVNEIRREKEQLILIASENYASRAVMEAQGTVFTNKYAEGYPGRRYYGGCEYVDIAETLAINRAKELFGAEHVNVQPHSGTQANMAVYCAMLKPGDKILGMSLSHGGHLSHGSHVNFSGIVYEGSSYGVGKKTGTINYNEVRKIAKKVKPKIIVAGASAYSRIIDFKKLSKIAIECNAYFMVDIAHISGLVAAGVHPSPVPYADFVTSTTHKTLRGPRGGIIMCKEKYAKQIDKMVFPGIQGGPLMHVIAAKAVALKEALSPGFKHYQIQIVKNAKELSGALIERGFKIISGGTDTHLMLIDLSNKKISGKDAETALDLAGITLNKNAIPHDKLPPAVTSGIRIGTPTVTTRGMKEPEMIIIAGLIDAVLQAPNDKDNIRRVRDKVKSLCRKFPAYSDLKV